MELYGEFLSNSSLRIKLIEKSCKDYSEFQKKRLEAYSDKVDEYTVLFLKGFGNDVELTSCFREALFNSRELLDSLLYHLNKKTGRTSKKFLLFAKKLMSGEYDDLGLEIITFLKVNINYIFHIRKIRNEAKINLSNIRFRLLTNRIEAYLNIPINADELELIQYLDVPNKQQVVEQRQYAYVIILDKYLPELLEFWECVFDLMKE